MTIPQRLDDIQRAQESRDAAASRSAASLLPDELLALMLVPILAETGLAGTLDYSSDGFAEVRLSPSCHRAQIQLGQPSSDALVVLDDLEIALISQDPVLRNLCPVRLRFNSAKLLSALQYARDDADDLLYRPTSGRFDSLVGKASDWGVSPNLLRALATDRRMFLAGNQ